MARLHSAKKCTLAGQENADCISLSVLTSPTQLDLSMHVHASVHLYLSVYMCIRKAGRGWGGGGAGLRTCMRLLERLGEMVCTCMCVLIRKAGEIEG